jgi:O-antigen/teichoic acid export membrane protein
LAFFWVLNREFFIRGTFNKQIALELAKIGLPLVPVFIFYWIYNSMDRIMIASMLGLSHVGIYAVGTKLASISSLIYAAFAGGWSYFAFSTMKDEGQVALNSKVFEYLGIVSFTSLVGIYPFLTPVFNLIFPGTYSGATFVVPYLYLSPLLLALFQVVSSQFLVIKKSYWSTITLTFGAVSNVLLNWWLIPLLGIEGAAIATAIGYALSVIAVCLVATRHGLHRASKRFWFSSLVLVVYLVLNRRVFVGSVWHQLCMSSGVLAVYAYMYIHELRLLYAKSRSLISGSKRK